MGDLPLLVEPLKKIEVAHFTKFPTLKQAYSFANPIANRLIGNQQSVIISRIAKDFFKTPRSRHVQLLGVSPKAGPLCEKLAPGGHWWVQCDEVGEDHQFMAWYSKYLPYAYAMMQAEDGFNCTGIQYESINAYYGTVMGYVDLGMGDGQVEKPKKGEELTEGAGKYVIEDDDLDLYSKCYRTSGAICSPDLPFTEAFNPACCFVAVRRPDLFVKHRSKDDWITKHVHQVAEEAGLKINLKWK